VEEGQGALQDQRGAHKSGNDRAEELAVAAKQEEEEACGDPRSGLRPRENGLPYRGIYRSGASLVGVRRAIGRIRSSGQGCVETAP
jgi:hypothetical protein